jgi:hypothetical protein
VIKLIKPVIFENENQKLIGILHIPENFGLAKFLG